MGGFVHDTPGSRGADELLAVMAGFIALIVPGLSVMAWRFVIRDRHLLAQLRAVAFAMAIQAGSVWPPLPSIPTE